MRVIRACIVATSVILLVTTIGCGRSSDSGAVPQESESTSAAQSGESTSAAQEKQLPVSFSRDVAPIFAAKCVYCHHPDNATKVDLTQPFDPDVGIVNRPNSRTQSEKSILVVPGDPEASALVLKVEAKSLDPEIDGNRMPWQVPRVTAEEQLALRAWIDAGATDDEAFRSTIAPLFGDGVSLGEKGGKCSYCHYSGADFGPDLTDVFNPKTGAVNVPAVRGDMKRIEPGDAYGSILYIRAARGLMPQELSPLMPWRILKLTDEEKATIREWIEAGAKND